MINHVWVPYANQTLLWLPSDTEELYNLNFKEKYELLQRFGWVDKSISYKFNSLGFRSEEFTESGQAMFLGCSHTAGVGLPIECTWPYYISTALNLRCYNLAIGGSSNDLAFRLAYFYIEKINPKIVFFLSPESSRIEVITDRDILSVAPGYIDANVRSFYKLYTSNEVNLVLNQRKNILALQSLCNNRNIKFVCVDNLHELDHRRDLARDLMHNGPDANFDLAQHFLRLV